MPAPLPPQRWEAIARQLESCSSEDDDAQQQQLLLAKPAPEDENVYQIAMQRLKKMKNTKNSQAEALAHFIAAQHRGPTLPSNIHRYPLIIQAMQRYAEQLMNPCSVDLLCTLHADLLRDAASSQGPGVPNSRVVLEAINTLEAVHRHPPAAQLFESLCSPSLSTSATDLYVEYCRLSFAKHAILRQALGPEAALGGAGGASMPEDVGQPGLWGFATLALLVASCFLAWVLRTF